MSTVGDLETPAAPSGLFYGWIVVGTVFFTHFIATGFVFYAFAVVLTTLADEFSAGNRTPILAVQMGMGLAGIVMAPIVGRLAGQGFTRHLMTAGTVAIALGLIATAYVDSLWQLAAIFAVFFAFGGNTMMGVTTSTIVVNWFDKRRASALAMSILGASCGGVVMAPIVSALVAEQGWRDSFLILGIIVLIAAPLVWVFAVGRPEDRGLWVDGLPPAAEPSPAELTDAALPFSTKRALREPNLWLIGLATGIAFMSTSALVSHLVAFGTDIGFTASRAAILASVLAAGGAMGKLIFGWLCDRVGESTAFICSLLVHALSLALLVFVDDYNTALLVVLITGIGIGGSLPLSSAILARAFGPRDFGPMMGLMYPIAIPFQLVGPIFAAWIRDINGNYGVAFCIFAGALVLAALCIRRVRFPVPGA